MYFSVLSKMKALWIASCGRNSEAYGYPYLVHDKKKPPKLNQPSTKNDNDIGMAHVERLTI
jgi:hypothetical protein